MRWIEPPDGEYPAAVTTVSERFPRQDAGGEAAGGAEAQSGQPQAPDENEAEESSDGSDGTARWLAAAALVAALASLAVALLRRRPPRPSGRGTPRPHAFDGKGVLTMKFHSYILGAALVAALALAPTAFAHVTLAARGGARGRLRPP